MGYERRISDIYSKITGGFLFIESKTFEIEESLEILKGHSWYTSDIRAAIDTIRMELYKLFTREDGTFCGFIIDKKGD